MSMEWEKESYVPELVAGNGAAFAGFASLHLVVIQPAF